MHLGSSKGRHKVRFVIEPPLTACNTTNKHVCSHAVRTTWPALSETTCVSTVYTIKSFLSGERCLVFFFKECVIFLFQDSCARRVSRKTVCRACVCVCVFLFACRRLHDARSNARPSPFMASTIASLYSIVSTEPVDSSKK